MGKKFIIGVGAIVLLVVFSFIVLSGDKSVNGGAVGVASAKEVTMYKSPNCGCCVGHSGYLKGKGFDVNMILDDVALARVKGEQNIPMGMRSCHTTFIDGYFVEGHMPVEAIEKLLSERPDVDGIALPDMPSGSPGMPGVKKGDWVIYSIKDGSWEEFMRI